MTLSIGQVAKLAGITVRTLHHYDEIALLTPSQRTTAGYRRYTDHDLLRLQQILLYRELGFPLEEITDILDHPHTDELTHLHRQHELLTRKAQRLHHVITNVERAIHAHTQRITLTPQERFDIFGDFHPEDHQPEVQRRWGDTDTYAESRRRAATHTKTDWLHLTTQAAAIDDDLRAAHTRGHAPDSPHVMDIAERHRAHITRWFYDCTPEHHRRLGDLYATDPRFTAHYDRLARGLAAYYRQAIHANSARQQK
ncbi:MerR family transcriptional regulator [Nonomuraea sp. NPDC047529]|uniref:MerR family transcriptional regulator n=1 Tax=Nonomuraea sp. NPDC047529 TaxID=3155623 RepID=UPI0033ED64B4